VSVSCEGFESPQDPYILPGSCSLGYTLTRTAPAAAARKKPAPAQPAAAAASAAAAAAKEEAPQQLTDFHISSPATGRHSLPSSRTLSLLPSTRTLGFGGIGLVLLLMRYVKQRQRQQRRSTAAVPTASAPPAEQREEDSAPLMLAHAAAVPLDRLEDGRYLPMAQAVVIGDGESRFRGASPPPVGFLELL
jgi:SOCE-associated regulatory factor of calcium homoeostasis